jgi:YD repeat-containing protein
MTVIPHEDGEIELDVLGRVIRLKKTDGVEYFTDYDNDGNIIKFVSSLGEWYTQEFKDGRLHHFKNSTGDEYTCSYDASGNLIKHWVSKNILMNPSS